MFTMSQIIWVIARVRSLISLLHLKTPKHSPCLCWYGHSPWKGSSPRLASAAPCQKCKISGSSAEPLNWQLFSSGQEICFNKPSRWIWCILKFGNLCSEYSWGNCSNSFCSLVNQSWRSSDHNLKEHLYSPTVYFDLLFS